jgi:site-specific DNA-methyltransferase (adenine-specific)
MNTDKKYQVVYADPPWHYHLNIDKASTNNPCTIETGLHYPTMTTEEICGLGTSIQDLTEKDAVLFMWVTDAHIENAMKIMKSWGFTYKTVAFVWMKTTKEGKPHHMMSTWTMKGQEMCLLGTKGAMMKNKKDNTIKQMILAPKGKHSAKPQEAADRIARMFPDCERIELFARDAKPGWDVWGNEITNTIEL